MTTDNYTSPNHQSANQTIFVTGATGAVGPAVVEALVAAGYGVRALVRQPPPAGLLPATVKLVTGDLQDRALLSAAMAGCQAVVHMAGLLHIVNPPPTLQAAYEEVNVAGTAHLLTAAQAQGVQRVIFFSTIAVYGDGGPHLITEATPARPTTLYGASKLAAEKLVLEARRADGEALGVVLRLAAVYGTRVKGNYQRLLTALARGRFLPLGRGANARTLVYDRDVAAATLLALQAPAAAGRIYNVTDGTVHTLHEIILAICEALGRRPPRLYLPIAPLRLLAGLLEVTFALVGRQAPIGRATITKYVEEIRVDGSRIQQEVGFTPRYSLAAGWAETVARRQPRAEPE